MSEVLKQIGEYGLVPVVKIEDAKDAVPLGKALVEGGLPLAEITFRTDAAEEAIGNISREVPEVLVGAGTVLTVEQVKRAVGAGAKFIVSPGFNPSVVDYCVEQGIPVTPGVNNPSGVEQGLERGLKVLKFFPAGSSGGVKFLKDMAGPYGGVKFIPTGGVNAGNVNDYLSKPFIHAVGGSWMVKANLISAGKFDEIVALVKEAIVTMLGFEFAHVGINTGSGDEAGGIAAAFNRLFSLPSQDGPASVFASAGIEIMKQMGYGQKGHIGIGTNSLPRAQAFMERQGVKFIADSLKHKDGKPYVIYLEEEVGGFAVHLMQK
jgi:2-dehydro-3-deoxyphosphogluconate aldolase/(4S)-4-hydroxy-2-oxoglutarate aldolase